jgi:hypothetical protein
MIKAHPDGNDCGPGPAGGPKATATLAKAMTRRAIMAKRKLIGKRK